MASREPDKRVQVLIILISNDDGIHAPGIKALATRLSNENDLEVYVVAPDRERSATGHSLTLHKPLRAETVDMGGKVKSAWSTTGTPSDCVKLAITELMPTKPDLVISGINNGPNLGSEILYSGTVAAAMEGTYLGISSIACSLNWGNPRHYDAAAEVLAGVLKVLPKAVLAKRSLVNVNIPNVPLAEIQGVRLTEVGTREYNDYFEKRLDPRGRAYYWLAGSAIDEGEEESSDAWAVKHNFVSISPVAFNLTDKNALEKLHSLIDVNQIIKPAGVVENKLASPSQEESSKPKG